MIARMSKRSWLVASVLAGGLLASPTSSAANRDMERLQLRSLACRDRSQTCSARSRNCSASCGGSTSRWPSRTPTRRSRCRSSRRARSRSWPCCATCRRSWPRSTRSRSARAAAVVAPVEPGFGAAPPPTVPGAPVAPGGVAGTPPAGAPARASSTARPTRTSRAATTTSRSRASRSTCGPTRPPTSRTTPSTGSASASTASQRYQEAIDSWKLLYRDFPSSDKLPDAHVKSGMAYEKLGRRSQALVEFRFVVDRYPNTQAARIARDRLNPN